MKRLLILLMLGLLGLAAGSAWAEKPLRLGILAFRSKAQTEAQWRPMASYLQGALGMPVEVTAYTFPEMKTAIEQHRMDVLLTNPGHYILLKHHNHLSAPLVTQIRQEEGHEISAFGGVIFARADTIFVSSLKSLVGTRIATTGTESLGGYQMQAYELLDAGLPLPESNKLVVTGMPHDKVVEAVLGGRADVGFVRSGLLESMAREGKLDIRQIKILNRQETPDFPYASSTRLYPEWPIITMPDVPRHIASRLTMALLSLPSDSTAARTAGIHGFSTPADYISVENLLRGLRMPPFDKTPTFSLADLWQQYKRWIIVLGVLLLSLAGLGVRLLMEMRRTVESELRTRAIMASSLDAIVQMSAEGLITGWNQQAEHIFGWTAEEAVGLSMHETIIPARYRKQHVNGLRRYLSTGVPTLLNKPVEVHALHRDGREFPVELVITTIKKPKGAVEFNAFARDISDRKRVETTLIEAKEAAEAATKIKADFLANMSHEIRTPMNAIIGFSHLGLEEQSAHVMRDYLANIHHSATGLLGIINGILDFSKISAGKLDIESTPFHLQELMAELRQVMQVAADEKGLHLTFTLSPGLPDYLLGDGLRLRQVLTNLIANAIKFTEQGQVAVRVDSVLCQGDRIVLRFSVTDTGIGMTSEQQRRLFQAFTQADSSTTRKYGGTGLGLAISQQLVQLMGGDIHVTSSLGKGTLFSFTIPLQAYHPSPVAHAVETPHDYVTTAHLANMRVLLVEDNKVNQMVLLALLKKVGIDATIANHGREAIEILKTQLFDLVLMDVQMPEMNGYEATAAIRNELKLTALPIIAITAHAMSEETQRCLDCGMNGIITKPIDVSVLHDMLSKYAKGITRSPQ